MKILDVDITNFLAITEAKISLADRGLVLVQGINHDDTSADSNGAGKSTLPDAVSWCFFGETARDVSGDDVINHTAGKGTMVATRVLDGALTYTIARHRKHKPHKNSLRVEVNDGIKTTDLTKGTDKLTQEVVNKIIGCSKEVFNAAIYAGQERMPDLPNMSDKELKTLIEEASGVTVLEEAYKKAREGMRSAEEKVDAIVADRATLTSRKSWAQNQITSLQASAASWVTQVGNDIAGMTTQVQNLVAEIKGIDISYDEAAANTEMAALDAKVAAVAGENAELSRLDRVANQKASDLALIDISIRQLEQGIVRLRSELANVEHQVGCPCDSCGRPLTDAELGEAKNAIARKIEVADTELAQKKVDRATAFAASQSAADARDKFVLSMTDLSATTAQQASLRNAIAIHQRNVQQRASLLERAQQIKAQIDARSKETNPFDGQIAALEDEVKKLDAKIATYDQDLLEAQAGVDLEAAVVKLYSPAGVRAHILDEVTPFLNQQTAKYLTTLSDGNIEANWTTLVTNSRGELREKFSIEVTNDKGAKSFKGLSGGEKRKVRLAGSLALQDLVASRASKPIELFIGDEIDDALDPAGLERLSQVLEEKARERGSVFVISHNELRDWIPTVIQIEKKGGATTVTEMTL